MFDKALVPGEETGSSFLSPPRACSRFLTYSFSRFIQNLRPRRRRHLPHHRRRR